MAKTSYFINQKLPLLRGTKSSAEVADGAGITRSFYIDLERGTKAASMGTIERLAKFLGVLPDALINRNDDMPISNALRAVESEWARDILEPYIADTVEAFKASCMFEAAGVSRPFVLLLQSLGYRISMETADGERLEERTDKHGGCKYRWKEHINSLCLHKGRHRNDIGLDDFIKIQNDTEQFLLFLLFKNAEQNGQRTRTNITHRQVKSENE